MALNLSGDPMSYYPVFLDLSGKKTVVIGGGTVAERKIEKLLECRALVHVISRELTPELHIRSKKGDIKHIGYEFDEGSFEDAFLIIVATDDKTLNQLVSGIARKRNILVNVADQPEECNFIVPSVIKRGDLQIAISTSGKSPAMAKKIREALSSQFGAEYESFLNMMANIRKQLLSEVTSGQEDRARIFHELVDSGLLESIKKKDLSGVASELQGILKKDITSDDVINYMKGE